jgi:putative hydrolase of the HAD superfamily
MSTPVVTFDAGQTLVDLDLDFLALRLGERDVAVAPAALAAAAPAAWRRYDALVAAGGARSWHGFMAALLVGAAVPASRIEPLVEWLWNEQPRHNLWRRPIAEMVALARELGARGARVAVLSNSEGRLADLLHEIGIADAFTAIVDSGRVGIEKPDPRIFALALDAVGATGEARGVHVGDSWAADVLGALAAGWRAVWYRSREGGSAIVTAPPSAVPLAGSESTLAIARPDVAVARDASEVRAALHAFGL